MTRADQERGRPDWEAVVEGSIQKGRKSEADLLLGLLHPPGALGMTYIDFFVWGLELAITKPIHPTITMICT
jgi:hypothetical protein